MFTGYYTKLCKFYFIIIKCFFCYNIKLCIHTLIFILNQHTSTNRPVYFFSGDFILYRYLKKPQILLFSKNLQCLDREPGCYQYFNKFVFKPCSNFPVYFCRKTNDSPKSTDRVSCPGQLK